MRNRQFDAEACTASRIAFSPQSPSMSLDNRARHGQADTHASFFCRHECVKYSVRIIDSRTIIYHLDQHSVSVCYCPEYDQRDNR